MTVDVDPETPSCSSRTAAEQERDLLYRIGRALIEHKERLYRCHHTGLTAEVAWPVMESILNNIRPYLKSPGPSGSRVELPFDPTPQMIQAALLASIEVRQRYETDELQPDSPGPRPAEMIRAVWQAMVQALPASVTNHLQRSSAEQTYLNRSVNSAPEVWTRREPPANCRPLWRVAHSVVAGARRLLTLSRQSQSFAKQ